MEPVHRNCGGLDVHNKSVTACVRRLDSSGKVHKHLKQFGEDVRKGIISCRALS